MLKVFVLGAATAVIAGCGGALVYSTAPIDATVVDADTGRPIQGAIVVASWQLVVGSLDGERIRGQLEVKETVTDRDGHFHFDGFTKLNLSMYELRGNDPRIVIFKGSYDYALIANQYPEGGTRTPGMFRKAAADGQTIRLKKLRPSSFGDRPAFYDGLDIELVDLTRDAPMCEWKKIPRLILAMDREIARIQGEHPRAYIGLVGKEAIGRYSNRSCGSVPEFFAEHDK